MPRPKKPEQDGKEVKKRSRNGCWPCKGRKVKCGEEKPNCINCQRQGETCDYSIRLNWDGRTKKKEDGNLGFQAISFDGSSNNGQPALAPASSHGSPNGSQGWHLSPQYSYHQPSPAYQQPSPAPAFAQVAPQEKALPPMTDFAGNLPPPTTDFNSNTLVRTVSWQDAANTGGFPGMAPIPSLRHMPSTGSGYPSPSDSTFGSPGQLPGVLNPNGPSWQMPPPTSNPTSDMARSPYNDAKRMRLSPRNETFGNNANLLRRESSYGPLEVPPDYHKPSFTSTIPNYLQPANPSTPGGSSTASDDKWIAKANPYISPNSEEDRRISVSSLLSNSPEPEERPKVQISMPVEDNNQQPQPNVRRGSLHQTMINYAETETYGLDRGYPDLDIPRNNDTIATNGVSPSEHSDFDSWLNEFDASGAGEFGFRLEKRETVFAAGGYYATPVPIKIPRKLEPLPKTLQENPMNLLYFHHFLNHTAKILVPHDCPENPFKTVLPAMAVENPNLLNLLLAYSASHRARLLSHPEPANRIAHWVRDVFPDLRHALSNISNAKVSNASLATAIMLASLEIISPSSFGVSIPWQNHLSIARSIIRSRNAPNSISRSDPVLYFLTRWLAYLDVLGSLSGRRNEEPLFAGNYWSNNSTSEVGSVHSLSLESDLEGEDDDYTIDCLLGFTTRCVQILAQVASLAHACDKHRIDDQTNLVRADWRPSQLILDQADRLKSDLEHARDHEQKNCAHHSPVISKASLMGTQDDQGPSHYHHQAHTHAHTHNNGTNTPSNLMTSQEAHEALLTNSAFHWAGLIHLLRRVHNLPRTDPQVQRAVHELVNIIAEIREGGSAEACLLFPMFSAGVEAIEPMERELILKRVKGTEGIGMWQVGRARRIMEEVWRTGGAWETVVGGGEGGEFFG